MKETSNWKWREKEEEELDGNKFDSKFEAIPNWNEVNSEMKLSPQFSLNFQIFHKFFLPFPHNTIYTLYTVHKSQREVEKLFLGKKSFSLEFDQIIWSLVTGIIFEIKNNCKKSIFSSTTLSQSSGCDTKTYT